MLLASATIWTTVARPRKKPIGCGWDSRVQRQIRDLKFSWQWCCIPCEKSAVRWCVRVFKVSFTFQSKLWHLVYLLHFFYLARIEDNDPGFERDNWMKRPNQRKHFELIDGTKRIQMKKETTLNSLVCIWSFTSLIAFIALTLLINLRLLMILRIPMVLILLR